jgi:hypothetical protein
VWRLLKLAPVWLLLASTILAGLAILPSVPSVVYASSTTFTVKCTMDNSATQATLTVSISGGTGTSISPSTALCDAGSHTITVTYTSLSGASTTITEPSDGATTRYRFSGAVTTQTQNCSGSSCPSYIVTNYEELEDSVAYAPNTAWDANYGPDTVYGAVDSTVTPTVSLGTISLSNGGGSVSLSNVWIDYGRQAVAVCAFKSSVSTDYWTLDKTTAQQCTFNVGTSGGTTFTFLYDLVPPTNENFTNLNVGTENERTAPETFTGPSTGRERYSRASEAILEICGNHTDSVVLCASGYAATQSGLVENPDCGNCLIANGKYYLFFANVTDHAAGGISGISINLVKLNFSDGFHQITIGYDNTTKSTKVYAGGNYVDLGVATVVSARHGSYVSLLVTLPVALKTTILDDGWVTVYEWSQLSDLSTSSWQIAQSGLQIVNQGGASTTILAGNATKIPGEGNFGCDVTFTGLCSVNSTYVGLQQYSTQFAVTLGNRTKSGEIYGVPYLWQPFCWDGFCPSGQNGRGEWSIGVHWFYYDNVSQSWVTNQYVNISLLGGRWDGSNQWTTLQVLWFQGAGAGGAPTLVKNDTVAAWIEEGPTPTQPGTSQGQVRIYLDMWLSNQNGSTIHGGRVGVYYMGMHSTGMLWWTSWSPLYQNQTETISQAQNLGTAIRGGYTTTPISAQQILCSKIEFTVSRLKGYGASFAPIQKYFHVYTHDFSIERFVIDPAIARDGGVGTPSFTAAMVPNLPQGSFFGPIVAVLQGIATQIWKVISGGLNAIWGGLGAEFPWFTGFWTAVASGIAAFFNFFIIIVPALAGFLNLLYQGASFVTIPFQIIGQAWGTIVGMFSVFKGVNISQVIELIVIVYFGGTIVGWAETGNWGAMIDFVKKVWGVANTMMYWTFWLVKSIIDAVMGLIP